MRRSPPPAHVVSKPVASPEPVAGRSRLQEAADSGEKFSLEIDDHYVDRLASQQPPIPPPMPGGQLTLLREQAGQMSNNNVAHWLSKVSMEFNQLSHETLSQLDANSLLHHIDNIKSAEADVAKIAQAKQWASGAHNVASLISSGYREFAAAHQALVGDLQQARGRIRDELLYRAGGADVVQQQMLEQEPALRQQIKQKQQEIEDTEALNQRIAKTLNQPVDEPPPLAFKESEEMRHSREQSEQAVAAMRQQIADILRAIPHESDEGDASSAQHVEDAILPRSTTSRPLVKRYEELESLKLLKDDVGRQLEQKQQLERELSHLQEMYQASQQREQEARALATRMEQENVRLRAELQRMQEAKAQQE